MKIVLSVLLVSANFVQAATLPGFRVRSVAPALGFISSIVTDSHGAIYYTTTAGDVVRLDGAQSTVVFHVATEAIGNSGLLGMALRDDHTAIVHYTTHDQVFDIVSSIDFTTGTETVLHAFQGDILNFGAVSDEHHGGNPIIAGDGSIFVAIGDGNVPIMAERPAWNLGKVFRLFADGATDEYARGVRNPFDMAWDPAKQRLIVPDNGDVADDEINIVHQGDDLGWPSTMAGQPAAVGSLAPVYVFPSVVAPTGIVALSGHNSMLRQGYLLAGFVTKAIYYIADIEHPQPIAVIQKETDPIVDVTESAEGDIYLATGSAIFQLLVPQSGDCDGNGSVEIADLSALMAEVQLGSHAYTESRASWGCDANGDGLIDDADVAALKNLLKFRRRTVR